MRVISLALSAMLLSACAEQETQAGAVHPMVVIDEQDVISEEAPPQ